jgi:tRNA(Ile)-lysidine synthase
MNDIIVTDANANSSMQTLMEVRRFANAMPNGTMPGVVAVSGGADSVALLRALRSVCPGPLAVAHLNHRLRGSESDGDEAFVRELSDRLHVQCFSRSVDVASLAAGENLEATARDLRYAFFEEVADSIGAGWIATGHTADDRAETVLHRLIRGTGLQGLCAIPAVRMAARVGSDPQSGRRIVRPLLAVARADAIEYLASLGQAFREDSSNVDLRFTRNRLRWEVLPLLKTFNPSIVAALGQVAEQASEVFELLEADAALLLAEVELPRAGSRIVLDAVKLASTHSYLVREALRLLWQREGWSKSAMTAEHWGRLVSIALGKLTAADFPGGLNARRSGRILGIGPQKAP